MTATAQATPEHETRLRLYASYSQPSHGWCSACDWQTSGAAHEVECAAEEHERRENSQEDA